MRRATIIAAAAIGAVLLAGCEFRITDPTPITVTPAAPPSIAITNTNTNTSTNNNDRSDTEPGATPAPGGGDGAAAPLPLPAYGEGVTNEVAAANPGPLAHSCQTTDGASAWAFLDLVVRSLRAARGDQRWGYLCKDPACSKVGADVVAYRASAGDVGIWIVDVIGNHCPGPADTVAVRWGVLPFETARRWVGVRP
jgi:hypothetical protein